jgi:hypothetical protein
MLDDDAPQPGMRMDEARVTERDQQVMLRGSGLHQQHIAAPDRASTAAQAIARSEALPGRDIGVAKPVPLRIAHAPPAILQRSPDKTEAIETRRRLAPV